MSFKRRVLPALGKGALLEIRRGLEIDVTTRTGVEEGRKVRGPTLPDHLDPKDPRWFSTHYIEPPKVGS